MARVCPHCNSSEIDEDPSRGDATCMECGAVLEESAIVSEVQFQERGGGHEIVGQFVGRDRGQPNSLMGVPGIARTESREMTFYRGKKLIQEIASQLRINQHCIDIAFNFYKMCVSRNFTRGRPRSQVVATCLYMTCRTENTPHLLLDFSDVTQINVFDLGKTLNFLSRSLKVEVPTTDPCLYILRFAAMLDLGDKQKEVVSLATRIVERMKRDWMSTGRRPTGLCGAALLLAAKAYNLNRSIADIVRIVHISEGVVRKRLDEFCSTPSGSLTIDEFSTVDLEDSEDPPSFTESRRKTREMQKRKEEEVRAEHIFSDVVVMQREIEEAMRKKLKRSRYAKMIVPSTSSSDVMDAVPPEYAEAEAIVRDELIDTVFSVANEDEILSEDKSYAYGPTLASLGIVGTSSKVESTHGDRENNDENDEDGELDLTGINDDEIDSYILNETESSIKSKVWLARNGEHLEEMERRRKLRNEEDERNKGNSRKKRKLTRRREPINAANHNDAIFQVIQEKNLSSKINYEILRKIEGVDEKTLTDEPLPNSKSASESNSVAPF